MTYILGLDLGQQSDYSALSVIEKTVLEETDARGNSQNAYAVRSLKRWNLGTSYLSIVNDTKKIVSQIPGEGTALAADATGIGRPILEMVRAAGLSCSVWPITITGGNTVTEENGEYRVPKIDLVGVVQSLLGRGRLKISPMKERAILLKEFAVFKVKVNIATGHESFEAHRSRDHDDCILSIACALWLGERHNWGRWDASSLDKSVRAADRAPKGVFGNQDDDAPSWKDRWPG